MFFAEADAGVPFLLFAVAFCTLPELVVFAPRLCGVLVPLLAVLPVGELLPFVCAVDVGVLGSGLAASPSRQRKEISEQSD